MSTEERIKEHIEQLFSSAPADGRIADTKNEIYLNTLDRYRDLLTEGKSEEEAYRAAIAGIGDVSDLIHSLRTSVPSAPGPRHEGKAPETTASTSEKTYRQVALGYLDTLLWMVTLTVYFIVSFMTMAWYITWVMFLITPALQNIIRAVSDLSLRGQISPPYHKDPEQKRVMGSINSAIWILTVVAYILISFYTGKWYITWVMFFFPPALESILSLCLLMKNHPSNSSEGENRHA